jgi:hypothetical protein
VSSLAGGASAATAGVAGKVRRRAGLLPAGPECGQQETSNQTLTMILQPVVGEPQGGFGACVAAPRPAHLTHRPGPMSRELSVETFDLGRCWLTAAFRNGKAQIRADVGHTTERPSRRSSRRLSCSKPKPPITVCARGRVTRIKLRARHALTSRKASPLPTGSLSKRRWQDVVGNSRSGAKSLAAPDRAEQSAGGMGCDSESRENNGQSVRAVRS